MSGKKPDSMIYKASNFPPRIMYMMEEIVKMELCPNVSEYIRRAVINQLTVDWDQFEMNKLIQERIQALINK